MAKQLGRTDQTIPDLGLGCVTFGREIDQDAAFELMDHAVARGMTLFDSAEGYGGGNARQYRRDNLDAHDEREVSGEMSSSELIVGRWLRATGRRDEITICTKMSPPNDPERIEQAVGDNLERLGVDCIDLYMLHGWDDDTPIAETLDALSDQVRSGRLRHLGVSNVSGEQLTQSLECSQAHGYERFEAVENNYNLGCREPEEDLFSICAQQQVSFIGYSPLGAGFLTGKYTPDREALPTGSRFDVIPGHCDVYFSERNFRIVESLRRKSEELGQSMASLAAAWVVSSNRVDCTLFGGRKIEHLDSALAALANGLDPALRAEMSAWE